VTKNIDEVSYLGATKFFAPHNTMAMASDDEDSKAAAATAAIAVSAAASAAASEAASEAASAASVSAAAAVEPSRSKKRKAAPLNSSCSPNPPIPIVVLKPDEIYVPWDRLASSRWGQDRLDRYISVPELDSLIGWATHMNTSSQQHYRDQAERNSHNHRHETNPLLGLASTNNAPPRPSILKHLIQDPATRMTKAKQEHNHQMAVELGTALKSSTTNVIDNPLWECMDHSAAVAMSIVAEEMLTALLWPLARRHVEHCRALEVALTRQRERSTTTTTTTTATATSQKHDDEHALLLARQELFDQWTLPPEEAILGLALRRGRNDGTTPAAATANANTTGTVPNSADAAVVLATAVPPTRTTLAGAWGTSQWLNQPVVGQREQLALMAWCRRHHANPAAILAAKAASTDDGTPTTAANVWRLLVPCMSSANGAPNAFRTI
jgi:hypothetical protein